MTTDTLATAPLGVPVLDVDPFSNELLADPYLYHAQLREAGPVAWIPKYGFYVTGRHEQVHQVLNDRRVGTKYSRKLSAAKALHVLGPLTFEDLHQRARRRPRRRGIKT